MEQETTETLVVYAPRLHAALLPAGVPSGVLLFDPRGTDTPAAAPETGQRAFWHPDNLPLPPREAKAWLREMVAYGMQFESAGQLAAVAAAESAQKLQGVGGLRPGELDDIARFASQTQKTEPTAQERLAAGLQQAQLALLLALSLEERCAELAGLDRDFSAQYARFGQALGLEDGDVTGTPLAAAGLSGLSTPLLTEEDAAALPCVENVTAMLAFVPEGAALYSEDPRLAAFWAEAGLRFASLDDQDPLQERLSGQDAALLVARATGRQLTGADRPLPEKPWLERSFRVVVPATLLAGSASDSTPPTADANPGATA